MRLFRRILFWIFLAPYVCSAQNYMPSIVRAPVDSSFFINQRGYNVKRYWYSDGAYSESLLLNVGYKTVLFDSMDEFFYSGEFDEKTMTGRGLRYDALNRISREGTFVDGMLHGHGSVTTPQSKFVGEWQNDLPRGEIINYGFVDGILSHSIDKYRNGQLVERHHQYNNLNIQPEDVFRKVFSSAVQILIPEIYGDSTIGVGFFISPTGKIILPARFRFDLDKIQLYVRSDSTYYPVQRVLRNYSFDNLLIVQIFSETNELYPFVDMKAISDDAKFYILTAMTSDRYVFYPQSVNNQIPYSNKVDIKLDDKDLRLGMLFDQNGSIVGTTDALNIDEHILGSFFHPLAIDVGNNNSDQLIRTQRWLSDVEVKSIISSFFNSLNRENYAEMVRMYNMFFYRYGDTFSGPSQYADVNWLLEEVNSSEKINEYKRNVNLEMADIKDAHIYRSVLSWHTTVKVRIGCLYELANPEVCTSNIFLVFVLNEENLISAIYEEILPNK